jgi:hypothetical protein
MIRPQSNLSTSTRRNALRVSAAAIVAGIASGTERTPQLTAPWWLGIPELHNNPDLDRLLYDIAVAWLKAWDADVLTEEDDRVTCQLAGDLA